MLPYKWKSTTEFIHKYIESNTVQKLCFLSKSELGRRQTLRIKKYTRNTRKRFLYRFHGLGLQIHFQLCEVAFAWRIYSNVHMMIQLLAVLAEVSKSMPSVRFQMMVTLPSFLFFN